MNESASRKLYLNVLRIFLYLEISALGWAALYLSQSFLEFFPMISIIDNSALTGFGMILLFGIGLPWAIFGAFLIDALPEVASQLSRLSWILDSGLGFFILLFLIIATFHALRKISHATEAKT